MAAQKTNDELLYRMPRELGVKHLGILGSFLLFLILPGLALLWGVSRFVFHASLSGRDPATQSLSYLAAMCACIVVGGLTGKYLWLLVLSRFVSKSDVSPFLAYGIPRRISRFDAKLLHRFYQRENRSAMPTTPRTTDEFTKREVVMLAFAVFLLAAFFTSAISGTYVYPKRNIGDWFVFGVLLVFVGALWITSALVLNWASRFFRNKA